MQSARSNHPRCIREYGLVFIVRRLRTWSTLANYQAHSQNGHPSRATGRWTLKHLIRIQKGGPSFSDVLPYRHKRHPFACHRLQVGDGCCHSSRANCGSVRRMSCRHLKVAAKKCRVITARKSCRSMMSSRQPLMATWQ